MSRQPDYRHVQRAPLCLVIYCLAGLFFVLAWVLRHLPGFEWLFLVGLFVLVLAGSIHYLKTEDNGDRLSISFGPVPLFRRTVRYDEIESVEVGRTALLDGWGVHVSLRGGWVWNVWGRDCVVVRLRDGLLRIGTDEPERLAEFLNTKLLQQNAPDPDWRKQ